MCGLIDCAMLVWAHDCVWLLAMRGEFCVRLGLVGNWLVNDYDLVCVGSVVFDLERRCCVVLVWILCFFCGCDLQFRTVVGLGWYYTLYLAIVFGVGFWWIGFLFGFNLLLILGLLCLILVG